MRYQVRQNGFGLALVEADSSMDALLKFLTQQGGTESDGTVEVKEDGSATLLWDGLLYYTEPPG